MSSLVKQTLGSSHGEDDKLVASRNLKPINDEPAITGFHFDGSLYALAA